MNPLPQRKKSPEEIAKLRQTLGIHPPPPGAQAPKQRPTPSTGPNGPSTPPPPSAMIPADNGPPQAHTRPQWRSFKRSENSPHPILVTPLLDTPILATPILGTPLQSASSAPPAPFGLPRTPLLPVEASRHLKPSRPLQPAASVAHPVADSQLPHQRHSPQELALARRRDALAVISHGAYQLPAAAHPVILACGYLLAIVGTAAPTLLDGLSRLTGSYTLGMAWSHGYHLLTACNLAALPIAAIIFARKSLSRHHAAFMAIIVFFALVFALIHYFSQLRHAT